MFKSGAHTRLRAYIAKHLTKTFPQLPDPQFSHIWCGYVGITTDFFPCFHHLGPNYIWFTGYSGRDLAQTIMEGADHCDFRYRIKSKPTG